MLELSSKIQEQVGSEITKAQRDHFLRQQIKAIQEELGEGEGDNPELDELWKRLKAANPPDDVLTEAEREIERLAGMHRSSAEYSIVRTYLDWMAMLPWSKSSRDRLDLRREEGPRHRPLRPGEGQGADPRVPGRSQAQEGHEGTDPLPRRSAGHGEDLAGQEHRRRRWDASSSGSAWAASTTRPRSEGIAGPMWPRCPGGSSRGFAREDE